MPQTKDIRIQSRLNPTIHDIMLREVSRIGMKPSHYMRMLILRDLQRRGALDNDILAKIVTG